MTPEESNAKLRRLVPWVGGASLGLVLIGGGIALTTKHNAAWILVVADLAFTLVLLVALWRALGRQR